MRILTLNINMFDYQIDNSFYDYLFEIEPDLAIIQEARFNRLSKDRYSIVFPKGYDKPIVDSRIRLTVAFYKQDWIRDDNVDFGRHNYSHIRLKCNEWIVLGLHVPNIKEKCEMEDFKKLYVADIVCGDFNASSKKTESLNYKLYQQLIDNNYCDLWEKGLCNNKAYYYNYKGLKLKAEGDTFFRTYSGNTHIDYILGTPNVEIEEITVDYRTLAFTDHCGIIVDVKENKGASIC